MPFEIDPSLYPDEPPPTRLETLGQRVDYLARLCAAWDFGLLPDHDTVIEIRREGWRDSVAACELLTSPAYHLLRDWHSLPTAPFLGQIPAFMTSDPSLGSM